MQKHCNPGGHADDAGRTDAGRPVPWGLIFGWLGLAFQAVVLVIYLPKSKYTANHAKQAIGMWLLWFLFRKVIGLLTGGVGIAMALNPMRVLNGGYVGAVMLGLGLLVAGSIGLLVLMILAMVAGFSGQPHRYPLIGDLIASIAGE